MPADPERDDTGRFAPTGNAPEKDKDAIRRHQESTERQRQATRRRHTGPRPAGVARAPGRHPGRPVVRDIHYAPGDIGPARPWEVSHDMPFMRLSGTLAAPTQETIHTMPSPTYEPERNDTGQFAPSGDATKDRQDKDRRAADSQDAKRKAEAANAVRRRRTRSQGGAPIVAPPGQAGWATPGQKMADEADPVAMGITESAADVAAPVAMGQRPYARGAEPERDDNGMFAPGTAPTFMPGAKEGKGKARKRSGRARSDGTISRTIRTTPITPMGASTAHAWAAPFRELSPLHAMKATAKAEKATGPSYPLGERMAPKAQDAKEAAVTMPPKGDAGTGGTGGNYEPERDEQGQFAQGQQQATERDKKVRRAAERAAGRIREKKNRSATPRTPSASGIKPVGRPSGSTGEGVGYVGGAETDSQGWVVRQPLMRATEAAPMAAPQSPIAASASIPRPFTPPPRFGRR